MKILSNSVEILRSEKMTRINELVFPANEQRANVSGFGFDSLAFTEMKRY